MEINEDSHRYDANVILQEGHQATNIDKNHHKNPLEVFLILNILNLYKVAATNIPNNIEIIMVSVISNKKKLYHKFPMIKSLFVK